MTTSSSETKLRNTLRAFQLRATLAFCNICSRWGGGSTRLHQGPGRHHSGLSFGGSGLTCGSSRNKGVKADEGEAISLGSQRGKVFP